MTADQARTRARALASLVEGGTDPRQQELEQFAASDEAQRVAHETARLNSELAFGTLAQLWLQHYEHEKEKRPSSVRLAGLVVRRHLAPALGDKPFPLISRADLQPIIDKIPPEQRGMRRAVFAYASVLFSWAAKRGDIGANPLADMAKPEAPRARDRARRPPG